MLTKYITAFLNFYYLNGKIKSGDAGSYLS